MGSPGIIEMATVAAVFVLKRCPQALQLLTQRLIECSIQPNLACAAERNEYARLLA